MRLPGTDRHRGRDWSEDKCHFFQLRSHQAIPKHNDIEVLRGQKIVGHALCPAGGSYCYFAVQAFFTSGGEDIWNSTEVPEISYYLDNQVMRPNK